MTGKLGFGGYRISHRSKAHREALEAALAAGLNLIDTSSNYTDGESEILIGEVLEGLAKNQHPLIVTKAGYIQGQNLKVIQELNLKGKAVEELVNLGDQLKHSIHPDFLADQLERSLSRLKLDRVDYFLLHNPEYYFKIEGSSQSEYLKRIKKAFIFLEEMVKKNKIGAYGISSNTFSAPMMQKDHTDLSAIIKIANEISPDHHFKVIQFPLNLIERGALAKDSSNKNLIELAKETNILTLANRPLNAFTNEGLIRLATYPEYEPLIDKAAAEEQLKICFEVLENRLNEKSEDEDIHKIPLIKQFKEMWLELPSPDAVEQVFYSNFFPLVAQIWGEGGIPEKESIPFYRLLDFSMAFSRVKMGKSSSQIVEELRKEKIIPAGNNKPLATEAIQTLLEWGVDYVLVGMKKLHYVNQLKDLI